MYPCRSLHPRVPLEPPGRGQAGLHRAGTFERRPGPGELVGWSVDGGMVGWWDGDRLELVVGGLWFFQ